MAMLLPSTIFALTIYRNSITLASSNKGNALSQHHTRTHHLPQLRSILALTIYRNSIT